MVEILEKIRNEIYKQKEDYNKSEIKVFKDYHDGLFDGQLKVINLILEELNKVK